MFPISTVIGFIIAYAILGLIMYILNKFENKIDVSLKTIEEDERKRQQAERASKRNKGHSHASAASAGTDAVLTAVAVAAVQQHRAQD